MIVVPIDSLSADALAGVIDAFILREGTDYGERETSFDAKRQQVLRQLQSGRARLVYYPEEEHIDIEPVD